MQIITRRFQVLADGYAWWRVALVAAATLALSVYACDRGIDSGIRAAVQAPVR